MLPISPIISSIITFLETQSVASAGGVISILQTVDTQISKPTSPQLQLAFFGYLIPILAMGILVFPFSSRLPILDVFLSLLGGYTVSLLTSGLWWPLAALAVVVVAYVVLLVCLERGRKKEDPVGLAKDVRDYYMTGICEDGSCSCVEIEERLELFVDYGNRRRKKNIVAFGLCGVFIVLATVAGVFYGKPLVVVVLSTVAFLFLANGLLTVSSKVATWLSSMTLRASIVILEALYIPTTETATKLLQPVAYCPSCTVGGNPLLMGNATAYRCTQCNEGWRLSPSGFPGVDYISSIIIALGPFLVFIILVYAVGLAFLEYRLCKVCVEILMAAGTCGVTPDDIYKDTLSSLHTPAVYTFFLYKRKYSTHLPCLFLLSKLIPPLISQLQQSLDAHYILTPYFFLNIVILLLLRPYHALPCLVLGVLMDGCNMLASLLLLFSPRIPQAVHTALKVVSASTPVAGWLAVFLLLYVRRRRREKEEEIEVDGVGEDGDVVRERMENLYKRIDRIMEKEAIGLLVAYGLVFGITGGIACGYYLGYSML